MLTPDVIRARLAAPAPPPVPAGKDDLNPRRAPHGGLRPASVLVPIIDYGAALTVLLTQRTKSLSAHPGQIAFPGGRRDPGDPDAVATALRETQEEVGLAPTRVEVIGRLETYVTRTGFAVTPVVGLIAPPVEPVPDPREVEDAFEVPLDFLIDPANRRRESRVFDGISRSFYAMPWQGRYIWGATAGMLVNLADRLAAAPGAPVRPAPEPEPLKPA